MEDIKDILINKGFKFGDIAKYNNIKCLISTNGNIYISILKDIVNNTYAIEYGLNFYDLNEIESNISTNKIDSVLNEILMKYI